MRALRRTTPAMALFPLRLFLGATFVYAGIQKLSDPGFLHPGVPSAKPRSWVPM
jgi:thiosulfate dehydrogenase (quinone) large subunit